MIFFDLLRMTSKNSSTRSKVLSVQPFEPCLNEKGKPKWPNDWKSLGQEFVIECLWQVATATAAKRFAVNGDVDDVSHAKDNGDREYQREYCSDQSSNELPNNEDSDNTGQNHEDKLCGSRHFYINS